MQRRCFVWTFQQVRTAAPLLLLFWSRSLSFPPVWLLLRSILFYAREAQRGDSLALSFFLCPGWRKLNSPQLEVRIRSQLAENVNTQAGPETSLTTTTKKYNKILEIKNWQTQKWRRTPLETKLHNREAWKERSGRYGRSEANRLWFFPARWTRKRTRDIETFSFR